MNMANTKTKKDMLDADIIAIGAIKYDTDTGEIEKFKSPKGDKYFPIFLNISSLKKSDGEIDWGNQLGSAGSRKRITERHCYQ